MEKRKKLKNQIIKFIKTVNSHHTGAFAAQAAYFFVLSLIPIILLLLAMVQYLDRFTEVTLNDVLKHYSSGVSGFGRLNDTVYYNQRFHQLGKAASCYGDRSPVVGRQGGLGSYIRVELYLCSY